MNRRKFIQDTALLAAGIGVLGKSALLRAATPLPLRHALIVDTYQPMDVSVDQWTQGRLNVVVRDVMWWKDAPPFELKVGTAPGKPSEAPPPGLNIWDHALSGSAMVEQVLHGINAQLLHIERHADRIGLARNLGEVTAVVQSGRIAEILMIKSAWINRDLTVLERYHRMGVRMSALTHVAAFDWADSSAELNVKPGLSEFGREYVRACNRLGIIVDISHAGEQAIWDTLETTTRPIIASHSECRAIPVSNVPRNISDEMLRALTRNGGMVGILAMVPNSSTFDFEQIDHAVAKAGVDHVGVCSHSIKVEQWHRLPEALLAHGYSETDTTKLLGGNFLRLCQDVLGKGAAS